ncbi:hypothetical protein M0R72_18440 [Candidatus Pacearchaeota archaeon]|nr:hypothetical protein [Candidatus Pacearchaeota archaeon]
MGKLGQAWDSEIEPVYSGPFGNFTALEHYKKLGSVKLLSGIPVGMRFKSRFHCGRRITVNNDGWAVCPVCGLTFNDGADAERPVEVVNYSGNGQKSADPPKKVRQLPHRHWRAIGETGGPEVPTP